MEDYLFISFVNMKGTINNPEKSFCRTSWRELSKNEGNEKLCFTAVTISISLFQEGSTIVDSIIATANVGFLHSMPPIHSLALSVPNIWICSARSGLINATKVSNQRCWINECMICYWGKGVAWWDRSIDVLGIFQLIYNYEETIKRA